MTKAKSGFCCFGVSGMGTGWWEGLVLTALGTWGISLHMCLPQLDVSPGTEGGAPFAGTLIPSAIRY